MFLFSTQLIYHARLFAIAPHQKGKVQEEPVSGIQNKQAQHFDWALNKLDSSVRRTGRITRTLLQRIFHDMCRTGKPAFHSLYDKLTFHFKVFVKTKEHKRN